MLSLIIKKESSSTSFGPNATNQNLFLRKQIETTFIAHLDAEKLKIKIIFSHTVPQ